MEIDQNSKPLITTIIPTFNRPEFLKRAIESVLKQTFTNFKVCIYDNSTDGRTEEIVKELSAQDKRVSYHKHEKNIGATANFAYGLNEVESSFFSFLSDDDILLPNFFEIALRGFEKHPDAGFFCGTVIVSNHTGKVVNVTTNSWKPDEYYNPPEGLFQMIPKHLDWMGVLFRVQVKEKIGGIDTRVKAIDVDYLIRAAAEFSYIVSKEPCGIFFQHPKSYSYYAGVKVIWPGYLHIFDNIKTNKRLPPEIISQTELLMHNDLQKKLFFFLIQSIKRRDYADAPEVIEIFRRHFKRPAFALLLQVFVYLMQKMPFSYQVLYQLLRFRSLVLKRRWSLQSTFGSYLNNIELITND